MELRAGYKRTEVGIIPKDWDVDRLGKCLLGSPDYGINAAAVTHSDSLPAYIRITDITDDGQFSREKLTSVDHPAASRYLLDVGDLLFARTGASVGKSYLYKPTDGTLVFAGFLIRVKPNPSKLLSKFLAAYVQTAAYWAWVKTMSMRSGQPGISAREFAQLPIPRPPVREQQAIADALSDCDVLVSSLNTLIAKKLDLMQGAMQQLLTGRMRLPGFYGKWDTMTLGEIFSFLRTANNPRSELSEDGDIKYIHYGDIHTKWYVFLDCANAELPLIRSNRVANVPFLEDGDLIMADASEDYEGVGISVEVKNATGRRVVSGLHTLALRGDKTVIADGFKGFLQFIPAMRSSLQKAATGISVYGISKSSVQRVSLLLPKIKEQQAIAEVLSDMNAEIVALEKKRDKIRVLKQGMMQELLTGKTRLV